MEGYIKEKNQRLKVIIVPYKTYKQDMIDIMIIIGKINNPMHNQGLRYRKKKRLVYKTRCLLHII